MDKSGLLRELESLPHGARARRMFEVGRESRTDPAVRTQLTQLEQGGFYERLLAQQSCFGSADADLAFRTFSDPSRMLRRRAVRLMARLGDDVRLCGALAAANRDQRLSLLRTLRKVGRRAPIDAFLDQLARGNDPGLDLVLPFGSPDAVRRHIGQARQRAGSVFWGRLAAGHPAIAAEVLLPDLVPDARPDPQLVHHACTVVAAISDVRPDDALVLVRALLHHIPGGRIDLMLLARRRPDHVADLVLSATDEMRVSFAPVAERLSGDRLPDLLRRRPSTLGPAGAWLRRLPAARRAALFREFGLRWRNTDGCADLDIVELLPRDLREPEARRHVTLPALATRPEQRLPYAGLLPWDEGRAEMDPWLKHPEPEHRAQSLSALIRGVRFQRERLPEALRLVEARRNEQDPVRLAMIGALGELPPGMWRAEHLEGLSRIIGDAFAAADLSHATTAAAESLIVRLLPLHPDWSVGWWARLIRERGQAGYGSLEHRLTDLDVRRIAPVLLPTLRAWQTREREPQLLALAQSLGRRLRAFPELADILEQMVRDSATQWVAEQSLMLIARHDRVRAAVLIPQLVTGAASAAPWPISLLKRPTAGDPSWVTRPTVYQYLHRRRQDLLTPFLGQQAYSGRFTTGNVRVVLPLQDGFFRWTPAQQATFSAVLRELTMAADTMRDTYSVQQAISQLAALPAVPHARLEELAQGKASAVRDAALKALGGLDSGEGVAFLVAACDDDRARVAIYALRSAIGEMPPARALELLRAVPLEKVTVAKEVVRLLGEQPGDAAFPVLREMDGRNLHRDVRVALLRALWDHLERPEAWEIIRRAAASTDAGLLSGVVRIPADRLSETARGRLAGVLAGLARHPDPTLRMAVMTRCTEMPLTDPGSVLLPSLLERLGSPLPDERHAAARAVFAVCGAGDAERVAQAVGRRLADRRALNAAVSALTGAVARDRRRLGPVAEALLAEMARDPLTGALRVELAGQGQSFGRFGETILALAKTNELNADSIAAADRAIAGASVRPDSAEGLASLETLFAAHADERVRRLAVTTLSVRAGGSGWNEALLQRLAAYRRDPAPLVASAAQFTLPVEEESPAATAK